MILTGSLLPEKFSKKVLNLEETKILMLTPFLCPLNASRSIN